MGRLDGPMAIVTAAARGERAGCLVGFSSQCSIDPELYMVWLSDKNRTFRIAASADHLAVHFPTPEHWELAELFGTETGDAVDKFEQCTWHDGPGGVPLLDDIPDWFVGRVHTRSATGDHSAHLLEPIEASTSESWRQLGFQQAKILDPGHEA